MSAPLRLRWRFFYVILSGRQFTCHCRTCRPVFKTLLINMMKIKETIATQSGWPLSVETRAATGRLEVSFESAPPKPCLLHWGVRRAADKEWQMPPQSCLAGGNQNGGK